MDGTFVAVRCIRVFRHDLRTPGSAFLRSRQAKILDLSQMSYLERWLPGSMTRPIVVMSISACQSCTDASLFSEYEQIECISEHGRVRHIDR